MDLKPNNILVTFWPEESDTKSFPRILIADPGLVSWSQSALPKGPNEMMSPWYRPPEMLCREHESETSSWKPNEKADVFALGFTLLQLVEGKLIGTFSAPPWIGHLEVSDYEQIARNFFEKYSPDSSQVWKSVCSTSKTVKDKKSNKPLAMADWFKLFVPHAQSSSLSEIPSQLLSLIRKMLAFNPDERPTVKQCLTEIVQIYRKLKIPKPHLPVHFSRKPCTGKHSILCLLFLLMKKKQSKKH